MIDFKGQPNPGSKEAKRYGCLCPYMDNNYGKGFILDGETSFWISGDCPMHARFRPVTKKTKFERKFTKVMEDYVQDTMANIARRGVATDALDYLPDIQKVFEEDGWKKSDGE